MKLKDPVSIEAPQASFHQDFCGGMNNIRTRRVEIGFEEEKGEKNEGCVEEKEFFGLGFGVVDETCHLIRACS